MLTMSNARSGYDLCRDMAIPFASPPLHGLTCKEVISAALLEHLYPTYGDGQHPNGSGQNP